MKKLTLANASFLYFLSSCDKELRKAILKKTTDDQLKLLVEIVLYLLRGVIPTSSRIKNLLRSKKNKKIVNKGNNNITELRTILQRESRNS
jgi:hypothetical protein